MSQIERVFSIDRLLRRRTLPTKAELLARLAVSAATLKRDLEFMRDRLHAPIIWDRARGGYRYKDREGHQTEFQVPGLWFSPQEIHALLLVRELLSQLQPGFLAEQLEPLGRRLSDLVEASGISSDRIVLHPTPLRPVNPEVFDRVAAATINRQRIGFAYFGRHRNEKSERIVSPQCLIYYRGTWYLDAWCHTREDWRRFALDSIRVVTTMTTPAIDRPRERRFNTYGIYAGRAARIATLHFDAEASRWVADEEWHPEQKRTAMEDGSVVLRVPFDNPQELLMDVLRYGKHVQVIEPEDLRRALISILDEARAAYELPDRRPPQSLGTPQSRQRLAR